MLKKYFYLFFTLIFSLSVYSQEKDPREILSKLTEEEINEILERVNNDDLKEDGEEPFDEVITDTLEEPINDEEIIDKTDLTKTKFGYDYFNKMPTSVASASDLPVPSDYTISMKDEISIILTGSENSILTAEVKLDGSIFIPKIGSVYVIGEKLEDVRKKN